MPKGSFKVTSIGTEYDRARLGKGQRGAPPRHLASDQGVHPDAIGNDDQGDGVRRKATQTGPVPGSRRFLGERAGKLVLGTPGDCGDRADAKDLRTGLLSG
jgi:hypothetical protein